MRSSVSKVAKLKKNLIIYKRNVRENTTWGPVGKKGSLKKLVKENIS